MIFIYALSDLRGGGVRYVGKTTDLKRRLYQHIWGAPQGDCHRTAWIRSLLKAGVEPEMTVLEEISEGQPWQERERFWIAFYRQTCDLVNGTDGGDGGATLLGRHHSPETCAKISAANKGRVISEAHRAAVSKASKGREVTAEERTRRSEAHQGILHTEESKNNIRRRLKNYYADPERRASLGLNNLGKKRTPEVKEKLRAASRRLWDDPVKGEAARAALRERNRRRAEE